MYVYNWKRHEDGCVHTAYKHRVGPCPLCSGPCQHEYGFIRSCGVQVCNKCGDHKGLARCYCGWSQSGGDGYRELVEMGERIEEDD